MWTLEAMRRFVLSNSVEISCPSCRGTRRPGMQKYKAGLLISPEWNDETCDTEASVQVVAIPDGATCLCRSLTAEEVIWCQDEAGKILKKDLQDFLAREQSKPKLPVSSGSREEDVALMRAY